MGNPIQEFYEKTGKNYDRFYSRVEYPGLANTLRLGIVLRRLSEVRATSIFEAGVGSGVVLEHCAAMGLRVSGLDFAPAMVEAAQARLKKAALFVADMEDSLSLASAFSSGPYDAVTASGRSTSARVPL